MIGTAQTVQESSPILVQEHTTVLAAENLLVRFGTFTALNGASLKLHSGDLLGLIGPNGAGKTTFLRTLCGLQSHNAGEVKILDEPLTPQRNDLLAHIGFTPDTPPLYEDLTVRQFLRFVGKAYELTSSDIDERIDFWLDKVWLREKAETKIKGLSRGMRQRVGIARTLLPNPAVILLDEPAAGLDPAGRVQFRQLLCDLRDQGKALIVSSHILADMADYCTRIGIMAGGRMMKFGTVAEVTHMHADVRCRYTIVLAKPIPQLAELFGKLTDVSAVQVERDHITFEFHNDRLAAAELLAQLIKQGLPIAAFSPNAVDLEEAYLRVGIGQVD